MTELYEKRLEQYICSSETKHKMEMDEIDERKSNQIMKLIKEHEESLADIRNYYTDIVQNNLTLIGSLKEQMEVLSLQLEKSEHQLKKVSERETKMEENDTDKYFKSNNLKVYFFVLFVILILFCKHFKCLMIEMMFCMSLLPI